MTDFTPVGLINKPRETGEKKCILSFSVVFRLTPSPMKNRPQGGGYYYFRAWAWTSSQGCWSRFFRSSLLGWASSSNRSVKRWTTPAGPHSRRLLILIRGRTLKLACYLSVIEMISTVNKSDLNLKLQGRASIRYSHF